MPPRRTDESAFRAVAHPVRRRMLCKNDLLVADLLAPFRLSRPSISQHLRVLRTSGLVKQRRLGRSRVYALDPRQLRGVRQWIGAFDARLK